MANRDIEEMARELNISDEDLKDMIKLLPVPMVVPELWEFLDIYEGQL